MARRRLGGQAHLSPSRGSYFGAIEVPIPRELAAAAARQGPSPGQDAVVKVWADAVGAATAAGGGNNGNDGMIATVTVSTVALLVETSVAITSAPTPAPSPAPTPAPTPLRACAAQHTSPGNVVALPGGRDWAYYVHGCETKLGKIASAPLLTRGLYLLVLSRS